MSRALVALNPEAASIPTPKLKNECRLRTAPSRQRKRRRRSSEKEIDVDVEKAQFKTRNSIKLFTDMVCGLSESQKQWAEKAGFGSLLKFKLKELPHDLGYHVLKVFKPNCCTLFLQSGQIQIKDEDVNEIFGLPLGNKNIDDETPDSTKLNDWIKHFPSKDLKTIRPKDVLEHMRVSKNDDELFRLNFLILMVNVLFKSRANGTMCTNIINMSGDLDCCATYKWCAFLRKKLIESHVSWNPASQSPYSGPFAFLILLYIDRVHYMGETLVDRSFPAFLGWTEELLRHRQTDEANLENFGTGALQKAAWETGRKQAKENESVRKKTGHNERICPTKTLNKEGTSRAAQITNMDAANVATHFTQSSQASELQVTSDLHPRIDVVMEDASVIENLITEVKDPKQSLEDVKEEQRAQRKANEEFQAMIVQSLEDFKRSMDSFVKQSQSTLGIQEKDVVITKEAGVLIKEAEVVVTKEKEVVVVEPRVDKGTAKLVAEANPSHTEGELFHDMDIEEGEMQEEDEGRTTDLHVPYIPTEVDVPGPKKRKHRPKVVRVGKPNRVSKSAPPKTEVPIGTPSGKKKYVPKKIIKIVESQQDPALNEIRSALVESSPKSCRRALNGASEGPISLDDFRSLQRSNTELRKQLEDHVKSIDALQSEVRAAIERHETEKKELRDSVSKSYTDQLNKLNHVVETKQKELAELNRISAEQNHAMEGLNVGLGASMQSCNEANEIIESQKASISKLEGLLDEERELRREDREKADLNLKTSIKKVQAESQEEMKRLSDAALRREKEQLEMIHKLQESEKERSSMVAILRSKLEDTRQKLVYSENKIRLLDVQICEEQCTSASGEKRVEELEQGMRKLRKELEDEKAAREEAWAKVSALELEMSAAMRDLDFERRKLKAARERIMLRETQLRSFYSTTEEISDLFAKQQELLKTMQRTLEDEENYDNISVDLEPDVDNGNVHESVLRGKEVAGPHSGSGQRCHRNQVNMSSDEASVTEKHDCDQKGHDNDHDTQEAEFTSADRVVKGGCVVKGGFGSDIDGVGTAPILEGDTVGTERVFETESAANDGDKHLDLNKLPGDTMQIDDDTLGSTFRTFRTSTFRATDLLVSEVAGSWACNTGPSIHGENDSPRSKDCDEVAEALLNLHDSEPAACGGESKRMMSVKH